MLRGFGAPAHGSDDMALSEDEGDEVVAAKLPADTPELPPREAPEAPEDDMSEATPTSADAAEACGGAVERLAFEDAERRRQEEHEARQRQFEERRQAPEAPPEEEEEPEDPAVVAERNEKIGVAQHLLLQAPPGEFREVLADVEALAPEGLLSKGLVAGVARAHNAKALNVAAAPDGARVVLCAAGEAGGPTKFRDAASGRVYAVDHKGLTATEAPAESEEPPEGPLEASRAAVQAALAAYVASRYGPAGRAAVHVTDGGLAACVRGSTSNLRNFYSGAWASTWTVEAAAAGFVVSGSIDATAHYFEDGNVQQRARKAVAAAPAADAEAVAALVEAAEDELHKGLEAMYDDMPAETLKAMRRVMPITRAKMKWNANEIALTKNLASH